MVTFYFHDILQVLNLSFAQSKALEKDTRVNLLKQTLKPFEGRTDIRVVLLILAEGVNSCPKTVEYIKEHPEWEIGCHGLHHEDYSKKSMAELSENLHIAKTAIETTFGRAPKVFVPPWKKYNRYTKLVCDNLDMKIELDDFFSIKHFNQAEMYDHNRFDVHHCWKSDRKNIMKFFKIQEFHNRTWKKNYKISIRKHNKLYLELRKYLNGKILDLACGITSLYDDSNYDVTGVDISKVATELMKDRCPSGTFITGDINSINFEIETFDTIILSSIIEHFKNFDSILIKSKKLLRKDGTIVIVVPENHPFRMHIHRKWDKEKIETEIGSILENITYYKLKLPHGNEWIIVYKKE